MSILEARPVPDQRHSRPQIRTSKEKHSGSDWAVKYGKRHDSVDLARARRIAQKTLGLDAAEPIEPAELKVLEEEPQADHSANYDNEDPQATGGAEGLEDRFIGGRYDPNYGPAYGESLKKDAPKTHPLDKEEDRPAWTFGDPAKVIERLSDPKV